MISFWSDIDEEIVIAIYEEEYSADAIARNLEKILGTELEENGSQAFIDETMDFPKDTIIVRPNIVTEELLDIVEKSIDIYITSY